MSAGGVRLQFAGTAAGHDRVEVEGDQLAGDACALFSAGAGSLEDLGREDRAVAVGRPAWPLGRRRGDRPPALSVTPPAP